MPESLLNQLNTSVKDRHGLRQIITTLSLAVILVVFWSLKLTGIGVAGEAFCGKPEHAHGDECFQKTLVCTLDTTAETQSTEETQSTGDTSSTGHTHTDACYETEITCQQEEHIHTASCYSDITADIETSDDWEASLSDMVRGPTTRENLILVARSQLGYTESERNFQVDAAGVRRGITRYGQWYGNPYGDWSAMFASFCLYYAGAEDAPFSAGPETMRLAWEEAGLYQPAEGYTPQQGDLVFLYLEPAEPIPGNRSANAVAVITQVSDQTLTVIQGNVENTVAEITYGLSDPAILGYGKTPEASPYLSLVQPPEGTKPLATATNYSAGLISGTNQFVFYIENGGNTYAIDGNGNAVQVYVGDDGQIYTDLENPDTLLWTIASYNSSSWAIQNVGTSRHLHPFYNGSTDNGITTPGRWGTTITAANDGVQFSHSAYVRQDLGNMRFQMTRTQSQNVTFQVGIAQRCTVWLDGTDGGLGHLTGSPDVGYTFSVGEIMQLPAEWTSPSKYSYRLRGWYDVTNARYYPPGAQMEVTGNAVLYADWVASTYDIGRFNAQLANTVSTNSFITTHMFDYNYLFNLHSTRVESTVTAAGHSEVWSMVTSGAAHHGGKETEGFVFIDNDSGGLLCIPNNRNNQNTYPGAGIVTPGIYSGSLGQLLFATDNCYDPATGTGVLGKTYLGTGDHLFQIMEDPSDEHYGYYYYDSQLNAASYHQSNRRFYVYEYLEATSDAIGSTNSDFLPLNSPYANTNGKTVGSYNYNGVDGEYAGIPHYRYDSKYNSGNYNSVNNVQTDYAYGMRTDITFYLPNEPGSGGNKDLYGNDMQFQFSGDDDLWVLIDGVLVLDIGGIHGAEDGIIDFSTGEVTVQGRQQTSLMDLGITDGDHTLSILYLERGSSMSNCSIYFNLAPRFGLELKKEDVLTQELLDGAQFTVYEDFECTQPAELWESEEAYNQDLADGLLDQSQSTFTVAKGVTRLWGLGSGNTYYIKETGPPDKEGYGIAQGVIRLTIEKAGQATYRVDVIPDAQGNAPSNGFTVHGVRIDEQTQVVYIVVTNAPETVTETTTVQVIKKWEDTADHSGDYIQAYLTVTDADGTVRRIREIILSDENGWTHIWTNLPKYDYDAMNKVQYGIEESYESGYYSTVRKITDITTEEISWGEATQLLDGSYLLRHATYGYLSTTSETDNKLRWVDEATAKASPLALWTVDVSTSGAKFTNGAGQTLTFNSGSSNSSRYFHAVKGSASNQVLGVAKVQGSSSFRLYGVRSNRNYYMTSLNSSTGRFSSGTSQNSGLLLTPIKKMVNEVFVPIEDWGYQITNTPLDAGNETSLAVRKEWVIPAGYDSSLYQEFEVTVRLLANGLHTGRSVTLNLKNGWQGSFLGLPYTDASGNVIVYTVEESWQREGWTTQYGPVLTSGGSPPTYSVNITNTYYPGGPELPATGSAARMLYVLCGSGIMLGTLVYGIVSRRKRERRFQ